MRLAEYEPDDLCTSAIAWEETACLLCGSERHAPLIEAADPVRRLRFLIVKCLHCGLSFTNPRPSLDSIERFYPDDYRCHQSKSSGTKDRWWRADPMRSLLPARGQARLLDFGCGAGDFRERMRALGWNAAGLDLVANGGTLPQPMWPEASFEAITMWQALEHVHQPLEVLRDAYRLLTPGGTLIVATPNFASWAAGWFGADWYGLDVPRHLTHFTADTLRGMLQRAGFDTIDVQQEKRPSWIRHSARSGWLRTRVGSGMAAWWGSATGRADGLLAVCGKLSAPLSPPGERGRG